MPAWLPRAVGRLSTAAARKVASACQPDEALLLTGRSSDDHSTGAGFNKDKRLLNAADYSRVFEAPDARASHRHLLLLARYNGSSVHRLGLVVAKQNVKLAVERNRVKRVAREFFRHLPASDNAMDVVLLARRGLARLDNQELSTILRQQWQKLGCRAHDGSTDHD